MNHSGAIVFVAFFACILGIAICAPRKDGITFEDYHKGIELQKRLDSMDRENRLMLLSIKYELEIDSIFKAHIAVQENLLKIMRDAAKN